MGLKFSAQHRLKLCLFRRGNVIKLLSGTVKVDTGDCEPPKFQSLVQFSMTETRNAHFNLRTITALQVLPYFSMYVTNVKSKTFNM